VAVDGVEGIVGADKRRDQHEQRRARLVRVGEEVVAQREAVACSAPRERSARRAQGNGLEIYSDAWSRYAWSRYLKKT